MESWLRRIRKFFAYSFQEQVLIIKAFGVVLLIRLGLKLLSFGQFRHLYASLLHPTDATITSDNRISQFVWAIGCVSYSLSAVCLPQALALKFFLRKDHSAEIVIGVDTQEGFSAHAWVEKNGKVLIGDSPQIHFQPIWKWQ